MEPHFIFITTDQQRTDSVGCYGAPFARTRALDGMARRGVRFDGAYRTNPVCTPRRASIHYEELIPGTPHHPGARPRGGRHDGGLPSEPR